jgi:hypothetical protein
MSLLVSDLARGGRAIIRLKISSAHDRQRQTGREREHDKEKQLHRDGRAPRAVATSGHGDRCHAEQGDQRDQQDLPRADPSTSPNSSEKISCEYSVVKLRNSAPSQNGMLAASQDQRRTKDQDPHQHGSQGARQRTGMDGRNTTAMHQRGWLRSPGRIRWSAASRPAGPAGRDDPTAPGIGKPEGRQPAGIRSAHVQAAPDPEVDRWLVAMLVLWEGEERGR